MRSFVRAVAAALIFIAGSTLIPLAAHAAGDVHKLALQVSDNNEATMTSALNVAANVSRYYSGQGDEVQIEIVAMNAGLHMLRADTSPVRDRIKSFNESMPNVTFQACKNTLDTMTRLEGKEPPLLPGSHMVQAGVVRLMELDNKGWTIIRP